MARFINEPLSSQVRQVLEGMRTPVEILFFQEGPDCKLCPETRELLEEVSDLSDLIHLSVYDLQKDAEIARQYHVEVSPVFVLASRGEDGNPLDHGIRFLGIPSGHEFTSLVNDLLMVSNRESALQEDTKAFLAGLSEPLLLQVFTTPTCPYCPRAVVLAHQMALESPWVQAEMIDAIEFSELADRYQVSGVPQTTINSGAAHVVGAVPEQNLVTEIRQALTKVNE